MDGKLLAICIDHQLGSRPIRCSAGGLRLRRNENAVPTSKGFANAASNRRSSENSNDLYLDFPAVVLDLYIDLCFPDGPIASH